MVKSIHIRSCSSEEFNKKLSDALAMLQNGCIADIEIQYKPMIYDGQVIYTALLIGRRKSK